MTQTKNKPNVDMRETTIRRASALYKLCAEDARIDEIENRDMDEGRFFVHLKPPYYYDLGYAGAGDVQRTQSFGTVSEARYVLKNNVKSETTAKATGEKP
jgi:hypothetical protein